MHLVIGSVISTWRTTAGLTQEQLAEKLSVSAQAVSNWENGKNQPSVEKLYQLAEVLEIPFSTLIGESTDPLSFDWELKERGDSLEKMFTRIKTIAQHDGLEETYRALYYARDAHSGQRRRKQKFTCVEPDFFIHPLEMTCHLLSMQIEEDAILAVSLLHDVCNKTGVDPDELPFSKTVRHSVKLLTKYKDPALTKEEQNIQYFDGISQDRIAAVVKLVERCNNVSTMIQVFSRERLSEYIVETEKFVLPLLKEVRRTWPEYGNLTHLVKIQMVPMLESAKLLLLMSGRHTPAPAGVPEP